MGGEDCQKERVRARRMTMFARFMFGYHLGTKSEGVQERAEGWRCWFCEIAKNRGGGVGQKVVGQGVYVIGLLLFFTMYS
jgi:hypothetical protein